MLSAAKYFQQGNYEKVIRILEPQVFEHRDDWKFYSYLGYSSLYTGDFIKASSYLKRALQLNSSAIELMPVNDVPKPCGAVVVIMMV